MQFNIRNLRCYGKEKELKVFYGNKAVETVQDIMGLLDEDLLGNFCEFVEMQLNFNSHISVRNKLHYFSQPIDLLPFFLDFCTNMCIKKAEALAENNRIQTFIENVSYHYDRGDRYDDASQHMTIDGVHYAMKVRDDSVVVPKYIFDYAALNDVYVLHNVYLTLKRHKFQGGINTILTDVGQRVYIHQDVENVFQSKDALGLTDKEIVEYLRSTSSMHHTEVLVHL